MKAVGFESLSRYFDVIRCSFCLSAASSRTRLKLERREGCHGNGAATQDLTSRKLRFSLLFLQFSVNLVTKISQILNTAIPDTSLACI